MATIKVDRGFTQKIQQKGMTHPVGQPIPSHRKPKPKGGSPGLTVALTIMGLVLLVVAAGITVAVVAAKKKTPSAPAAATRPAPAPAATSAVGSGADGQSKAADAPVPDVEADLYGDYQPKVMPAGSSTQVMATASNWSKPVYREVPLGSRNGLLCEYYLKVDGHTVDDLRKCARFPDAPDKVVQVGKFELSERLGEHYGVRVRGYVVPPQTGSYTFVVNVDDAGELWLSADENPANKRRLVALSKHTCRKWDFCVEQQSARCELEAGKRYYIEALMLQCAQGDYLAVGWFGPVSDKVAIIGESYLRPWSDKPDPVYAWERACAATAKRRQSREGVADDREAVAAQPRVKSGAHDDAEVQAVLERLAAEVAAAGEEALRLYEACAARSGGDQPGLLAEFWDGVTVQSLDELRSRGITRQRPPDESLRIANFESPTNRADNYIARITGFLTPRVTGEYVFYVAADDGGELWLSQNEDSAAMKKIAACAPAVGRYEWDKARCSEKMRLEAGRRYAIKGLLREAGKSDHFEAGWRWAAEADVKLITSEYLSCAASQAASVSAGGAQAASTEAAEALRLAAEALTLCATDGAAGVGEASDTRADVLRKRAERAREALQKAQACLQRAKGKS